VVDLGIKVIILFFWLFFVFYAIISESWYPWTVGVKLNILAPSVTCGRMQIN